MAPTKRTVYTQGLRGLADILDDNPDVPLPHSLSRSDGLLWYIHEPIEAVLEIRALMVYALTAPYESNSFPVEVSGILAGFDASVLIAREIALEGAPTFPPAPINPRLLGKQVSA
jgi:hypothetical protein